MLQNRPENPDVPHDPALQEAFDAFIQQTRVPLDFHTRVMARVQQRPARRGLWGWLERWWTWWTHHWSPFGVLVATVCVLLSLAFNLGLGSYAWKHRQAVTSVGQELTAAQAQVREVQAENRQWQTRHAALSGQLAALQEQVQRKEQDSVALQQKLTAAQEQVREVQAENRQWQTRHAALSGQLAALQEQRAVLQEPLAAQVTDLPSVDRSILDQADAAFNRGRYDEAITLYSAIIHAEPTNIRAYLPVGRAYAAKGRYDDAVAAFNKGLQQKSDSALKHAIYQELGVVYGKQGRDDEATAALREATKLAPHNFHAQHMLGAAYLQKGLQSEARAALEEALRLAKASPGGKDLVPSIEAMLRYLPPLVPNPPTSPPPEKFKLTVQATPANSTIKFANSQLEYRPGMELAPGRYDLVVTRDGYKPARQQVTVSTADVTLDVALELIKYKLTVQATPADSTIKFDNSKVEYWPGVTVEPGRYEVVVTRNGYKPGRRWVTIHDADVSLDVALEPEKYKLTVRAKPTDSYIKLANSTEEYQPGMELVPGRYEVVVERQGYKVDRRWVTISNADVALDVALDPDKAASKAPPAFGVDTSPPSIVLKQESIPKNVGPTQSRVIIIGHATDDSGVAEVTVNGKKAELGADGTFAVEVLLRVGHNPIRVTALDINGNEGHETFTISRESAKLPDPQPQPVPVTAPTIVLLSPEGLRVGAHEASTTLRGRVTAPNGVAEVTVNGNAAALESDGTFSVGITLDVGENPIVVAAMDTQRQVTEQTFTISRPLGPGSATQRLALLVGNAKYPGNPLRNTVNDASDMNTALKKLGFETTLLLDATFEQMKDAIDAFGRKLRHGGVGLFYYAGHGVQIEGQNYLIPVDTPLQTAARVKYMSCPLMHSSNAWRMRGMS